jgi:hypothetical protein
MTNPLITLAERLEGAGQWPHMKLCPVCGNKRCPHSDDPANACTGSNEPGQAGSRYARTQATT